MYPSIFFCDLAVKHVLFGRFSLTLSVPCLCYLCTLLNIGGLVLALNMHEIFVAGC